jgi:hypothetical protein
MFAANTGGSVISVVLGGTLIPLPDSQNLDGFTVDGTSTVFTAPESGRYYITYDINITAGVLLSSEVLINGVANPALTRSPVLAVTNYSASAIVDIVAGDTISLQLSGLLGIVTLQSGAGASLTLIRLS